MSPSRARLGLAVGATLLVVGGVATWAYWVRPLMAARIIEKAAVAEGKVSFQADGKTQVVYGSKILESRVRISNGADGRSAISYRGGPLDGVTIGNDGTKTWRYDPRARVVYTGPPNISGASTQGHRKIELMLSNYTVQMEDNEEIAGRPAYRLYLSPKEAGGKSRRLWIDRETNIVLASEELDAQGRRISQTRIERIDYRHPPTPQQLKAPPPDVAPRKSVGADLLGHRFRPAEMKEIVGFEPRVPTYLPKGYELDGSYLFHCTVCHSSAAETRFTNGMDSFSIFEGQSGCDHHGEGKAVARVGNRHILSWKYGGNQYCLMGSLALEEMKKVAASMPGGAKATSRQHGDATPKA